MNAARNKQTMQAIFAELEHGNGKPYVAANRFTAADISIAYIATGAKFVGIEDEMPPLVRTYVENLHQRPAFQRAAAVK